MRAWFHTGCRRGGVLGYPLNRVYREVAKLGCMVHWTLEELMNMDHAERLRLLKAVDEVDDVETWNATGHP
jgi:hypothetical protein